jgi:hypothetical protein
MKHCVNAIGILSGTADWNLVGFVCQNYYTYRRYVIVHRSLRLASELTIAIITWFSTNLIVCSLHHTTGREPCCAKLQRHRYRYTLRNTSTVKSMWSTPASRGFKSAELTWNLLHLSSCSDPVYQNSALHFKHPITGHHANCTHFWFDVRFDFVDVIKSQHYNSASNSRTSLYSSLTVTQQTNWNQLRNQELSMGWVGSWFVKFQLGWIGSARRWVELD